jgi:hypothetical protein
MRQADENRQFCGLILPKVNGNFSAKGAEFRGSEIGIWRSGEESKPVWTARGARLPLACLPRRGSTSGALLEKAA